MEEIRVDQSVSSQLKENKNNSFLVTLLSVLLLISVFIAGFFAWKTQKLVKDLRSINEAPKPTPVATTTPDPTANWKLYRSERQKFSFKLPQQLVVSENKNNIEIFLNQESFDRNKVCKPNTNEIEPLPCSPYLISILYKSVPRNEYQDGIDYINKKQGGVGGEPPYKNVLGQNLTWVVGQAVGIELRPTIRAFAYDTDKIHFIETNTYTLPFWRYSHNLSSTTDDWQTATAQTKWSEIEDLTYQILSTFKFTESDTACTPLPECAYNTDPKKPTCKIGEKPFEGGVWCPRPTENPTQTTACTMDAKICPDGSAVGRSGSKCEFAPCPTPKP